MSLNGIEGRFQHYAVLRTNDTVKPTSILRMTGGVPRTRVISSDVSRSEDLPQGSQITQRFYVGDPGFSGAKVRHAGFVPIDSTGIAKHLSCTISYTQLGKDAKRAAGWFHARPTDYEVQLAIAASPDCPLGPFQGEVRVSLEVDGSIKPYKVAIEGAIVPDVDSVPRVALISLDRKGTGSVTFRLRNHSKKTFRVIRLRSDSPECLQITPKPDAQDSNPEYTITAHIADPGTLHGPRRQAISCEMDDGSVVSVPVTLFMPPPP